MIRSAVFLAAFVAAVPAFAEDDPPPVGDCPTFLGEPINKNVPCTQLTPEARAKLFVMVADLDVGLGHLYKHGLQYYDAAIALDPKSAEALAGRAHMLTHLGQLDQAEASADTAYGLAPDKYEVLEARGEIYLRQGKYYKAVADLTAAIAAKPTYQDPHALRMEAYQAMGNQALADADRAEALRTSPKWDFVKNAP